MGTVSFNINSTAPRTEVGTLLTLKVGQRDVQFVVIVQGVWAWIYHFQSGSAVSHLNHRTAKRVSIPSIAAAAQRRMNVLVKEKGLDEVLRRIDQAVVINTIDEVA